MLKKKEFLGNTVKAKVYKNSRRPAFSAPILFYIEQIFLDRNFDLYLKKSWYHQVDKLKSWYFENNFDL